jgi:thiol-disulfide isomerase/thioredoxin
MKSLFIALFISALPFMLNAQDFQRIIDKKTDRLMLTGRISFDDIRNESAFGWFDRGASTYDYNKMVAENLERFYAPYHFVVFMGTWCGDSQDIIPKLYTVLKNSHFDFHALTMYAVDRDKKTLNDEAKNYNITLVPTIIVLHGNREVGRITESVQASIEHDLLAILEKDFLELEKKRMEKWGE